MKRLCQVTALLVAATGQADLLGLREPSPVILPQQRIPLSFSHRQHVDLNVKCDFCHESAPTSKVARDLLIPDEETCATCHPIDRDEPNKAAKPVAACGGCHPGFSGIGEPARVEISPPLLKFNHQVHVSRGVDCERCHPNVRNVDLATRADLPTMSDCLQCHDGRQAPAQCTTCHLGDAEGRIRTELASGQLQPSGVLRGDAHDLRFKMDHRRIAHNDSAYCENCHRQDWCMQCHNGVTKPLDFHGNDYLSLHAIEARRNTPDCSSCHRRQTFCVGCHQQSGVTLARESLALPGPPDSDYNSFFTGGKRFHPDGWADSPPRGPNHHSTQAQRNIAACASCHREETCLACHATGAQRLLMGVGATSPVGQFISPHPANFRASGSCRSLRSKNQRVCLKCHAIDNRMSWDCR